MIIWITGNSGAGKTTLANQMKGDNTILLDGDIIREIFKNDKFDEKSRWANCVMIARLAKSLDDQGKDVIIAAIAPYKALRDRVKEICNCSFIYLKTEPKGIDYPYEMEDDKFYLEIPKSDKEKSKLDLKGAAC